MLVVVLCLMFKSSNVCVFVFKRKCDWCQGFGCSLVVKYAHCCQ